MRTLGIVSNRRCDRNREGCWLDPMRASHQDAIVVSPESRPELAAMLLGFAERGIDVVAIDGGDGTIRDVLSAWPTERRLPSLVLFPSGKTNAVARDVGFFDRSPAGLEALLAQFRNGHFASERSRPCLDVRRPEGELVMRGFIFGAGVYTRATLLAGEWVHQRGIKQRVAVGLVILRTFLESIAGRPIAAPISVSLGTDEPGVPHFLVLATTLDRLMLGFWPFSGDGVGALKWLSVEAPPRQLTRTMWLALRRRMRNDPGHGCRTGRTCTLPLGLIDPFVVDGEVFEPAPGGLVLCTGPSVRFLSAAPEGLSPGRLAA